MKRAILLVLFASLPVVAETTVSDQHITEALKAAGQNRSELQRVLDHFAKERDARKLTAARFLIANMPGHGYIVTRLVSGKGVTIPYDATDYASLDLARAALDALEKEHGTIDFKRDKKIEDVATMTADYLIRHIDNAFVVWERTPKDARVSLDAFLNFVLPYRGSQEPIEDWLSPLMNRYAHAWLESDKDQDPSMDPGDVAGRVSKDLRRSVRFNDRFYLHPTDQSFTEMLKTGQGRCEDLTNLSTYAKRSVGVATAADYTPWWARGSNNHAWDVVLDAEGKGRTKAYAHAGKIYRKTFAIQRDNLCFQLPKDREAANRFLSSPFYIDVTDQYAETTQIDVAIAGPVEGDAKFAYLCVFNTGVWKAIQWSRVVDGRATFDRMGRNIVYLPMTHDGKELHAAGRPVLALRGGSVVTLTGKGAATSVLLTSVSPRRRNVDTLKETPVSYLNADQLYILKRWDNGGWQIAGGATAKDAPLSFSDLPSDGLYWLVPKDESTRRLERVFTIEDGRQIWW